MIAPRDRPADHPCTLHVNKASTDPINTTATNELPEEYTRGQVDDAPLSPVDEAKDKLDKLLSNRPAEKELVEVRHLRASLNEPSSYTGTKRAADTLYILPRL